MPTERPRIQAYLEPELHNHFLEWKRELGIAKDSEALNVLLAEYFGVSPHSPFPNSHSLTKEEINETIGNSLKSFGQVLDLRLNAFQAQIDSLKQLEMQAGTVQWLKLQIADISDVLNKFKGDLGGLGDRLDAAEDSLEVVLSDSRSDLLTPVEDARSPEQIPQAEAPGLEEGTEGGTEEELAGEPLVTVEPISDSLTKLSKAELTALLSPLTQTELAKRLLCHKSMISRYKEKVDFQLWSRARDPDAIAWRYDRKKQKFFPVS